jgi:hypothetical protein
MEFTAINNVFRCMHDAPNVQWDHDVYKETELFAKTEPQGHSKHRNGLTGENMAWQRNPRAHPAYKAAHRWYAEIVDPCRGDPKCYQGGGSGTGHFTATVWKGVRLIAFAASPSGKVGVGRYQCDVKGPSPKCSLGNKKLGYGSHASDAPNWNGLYKEYVPLIKHSYASCVAKVEACPTFKGYKIPTDPVISCKDVKGADADCTKMYDSALYDGVIPSMVTQSSIAPMVGAALVTMALAAFALMARQRWKQQRKTKIQDASTLAETGALITSEDGPEGNTADWGTGPIE